MTRKRITSIVLAIVLAVSIFTITVFAAGNPAEDTVTLANGAKVNGKLSCDQYNATALTQLQSLPNNYGISVGVSIQGAYQERDTMEVVRTGNGTGGQYGCSTSISNQGGMWIVLMSQHNGRCDGESASFSLNIF